MRILHTGDWHLGKKLEGFSRMEEQRQVLDEICGIAEAQQVDAVLIAGDIYDTFKPPVEAEELFYSTAKRLSANGRRAVIVIAGNHDSPDRITAPEALARECGIILAGYPDTKIPSFSLETGLSVLRQDEGFVELKLPVVEAPLRLLLTPYANENRLKSFLGVADEEEELRRLLADRWGKLADRYCDDKGVNMLLAHLLMARKGAELPDEPEAERSIIYIGGAQAVYSENVPPQIQYVALGHLHRRQRIDEQPCPVVYSGSPLCYSMSEAGQQKYVDILHARPGKAIEVESITLKAGYTLYRQRFTNVEAAVYWLREHPDAIVELTMETDNYLRPEERRMLAQAHERIIGPIPVVRNISLDNDQQPGDIDLSEDIGVLFTNYFKQRNGQLPGSGIIELFNEVISLDDEPEEA